MLVEWNDTTAQFPQNCCIHELFETQVERTPDAVAVVFRDHHLTYEVLNRRANQLAHILQRLGVGPETVVGLCVERSLDMIIGGLGILKAGGAYVPLDPAYPQERLTYIAKDSRISVLLTQKKQPLKIQNGDLAVVYLDFDPSVTASEDERNPIHITTANNMAYIIYTSGSTGKPKGVMGLHRGTINRFHWMWQAYPFKADEVCCQKTSLNFVDAVWEIWGPLLKGIPLIIIPDVDIKDTREFFQTLIQHCVTRMVLVPSLLRLLLEGDRDLSSELRRLNLWTVSGEALSSDLWQHFHNKLPDSTLLNLYGSSEVSADATWYNLHLQSERQARVPIGRPLANVKVYILDHDWRPVPVGVRGELCVGGACLGRGYLNRPGMTADAFIPNPFGEGTRLYRTGDSARYLPDGNIEFLGRIDHQVKIHGFRIELKEIEVALAQHPKVRETLVTAFASQEKPWEKRLVAYIIAKDEHDLTVTNLRTFLKGILPEYMIPSAFVFLKAFPLLPNGKVDRQNFPEPDTLRPELEQAFVAPHTSTEKKLAKIWCEILKIEEIGIHDNFFDLGGDSMLALRVVDRIRQTGLSLTPQQFIQHPTIADLATMAAMAFIQFDQGPITGPIPLMADQHWLLNLGLIHLEATSITYLFEVHYPLEPTLLRQTLRTLLIHHDALRSRFVYEGSGWQQFIIAPDDQVPFEHIQIDLSQSSDKELLTMLRTDLPRQQQSLNLASGPLIRLVLLDVGSNRPAFLFFVVHHLVADGASTNILLQDMLTVYQQLSRDEKAQLPPKTTSVKEWANRLHAYARSEELQQEVNWWLDLPWDKVAPIPLDFPENRDKNYEGSYKIVKTTLTPQETSFLRNELPRRHGIQVADAVLAAQVQSLTQWMGCRWLSAKMIDSGRNVLPNMAGIDLSRTVGWLSFPGLLMLECGNASDPIKAVRAIKKQVEHTPNRGLDYSLLLHCSDNEEIVEKLLTIPSPEVWFNYMGETQVTPAEEPTLITPSLLDTKLTWIHPQNQRAFILILQSRITDRLNLWWNFSTNIHKESTIQKLAQDCLRILRSLIASC
jgi:amino acid adenylation domain-containing protein/non-ribosomal peptide synthase protein (TIGR01720 family)